MSFKSFSTEHNAPAKDKPAVAGKKRKAGAKVEVAA